MINKISRSFSTLGKTEALLKLVTLLGYLYIYVLAKKNIAPLDEGKFGVVILEGFCMIALQMTILSSV